MLIFNVFVIFLSLNEVFTLKPLHYISCSSSFNNPKCFNSKEEVIGKCEKNSYVVKQLLYNYIRHDCYCCI